MTRFLQFLTPEVQARVRNVDDLRVMFDNMASSSYSRVLENDRTIEFELNLIFQHLIRRNLLQGNEFGSLDIQEVPQNYQADMLESSSRPVALELAERLVSIVIREEHCSRNNSTQNLEPPTCTICFEDLVLGEQALSMPCQHLFHPS